MKQPELGKKVAELRQQKGLTQEQLAEFCEVSTRTIQRIESGEVDPRAFTINRLSAALDFEFVGEGVENENLWLAVLHLSSILPLVILPLLIWSWKKNQSGAIDSHGKDVLNFQITMMLVLLAFSLIFLILPVFLFGILGLAEAVPVRIGLPELLILLCPLPLVLVGIFTTFQGVINAVRVLSDRPYRYIISIPFVK